MGATGRLEPAGSTVTVRFDRNVAAPPEQVWAAITEPEQIARWLAPTELDGRIGGEVHIVWPDDQGEMHGIVRAFDPPSVLEYSWGEGDVTTVLRIEVEPNRSGSAVRLIHSGTSRTECAGFGAGWQSHLEALDDVLAGKESASADRDERYRELRPDYEAALKAC